MTATPVIAVCGGLGSGKTSLLRCLLEEANGLRFAAIVNDFGEVCIDGELLSDGTIDIIELANGCVCCTLQGDLSVSVRRLVDRYAPDYLLIELSGAAEPAPVINELQLLVPLIDLRCVVTVVDLSNTPTRLIADQHTLTGVSRADLLVMNKVDLIDDRMLQKWNTLLSGINGSVPKLETTFGRISLGDIAASETEPVATSRMNSQYRANEHHNHNNLEMYTLTSQEEIPHTDMESFMSKNARHFVRAKGFFVSDGKTFLLQCVRGRWTVEPFTRDEGQQINKLTFISDSLSKSEIAEICHESLSGYQETLSVGGPGSLGNVGSTEVR